jgi:hypothetical protein
MKPCRRRRRRSVQRHPGFLLVVDDPPEYEHVPRVDRLEHVGGVGGEID